MARSIAQLIQALNPDPQVYQLCGLTPEEIPIVEEGAQ
jgi:hypothetical protein